MGARRGGDDTRVLVQVRLDRELVKQIDHLAIDADLYRAGMVEELVRLGIEAWRRDAI